MLTAAQRTRRQTGIGASEVAAILGLSRYRTALDVYLEKTGTLPPDDGPDSPAAEWGHRLEEPIALAYLRTLAGPVGMREGDTVSHPINEWAIATPDRILEQEGVRWLLEIKTRRFSMAQDFGVPHTDQIPDDVLCQVQWQLYVTNLQRCDVAVLIDGHDFRVYRVTRSPELIAILVHRMKEFWCNHVLLGVQPPVVAEDVRTLSALFPTSREAMAEATTPEEVEMVEALAVAKDALAKAEHSYEYAEAQVKAWLADRAGVRMPGVSVTWRTNRPSRITNWQAVAGALNPTPDLIEVHTTERPGARPFRVTLGGK